MVDASVWVSRLVSEDIHHAASRRWLEQHVTGGGVVVAPVLLLAEVAGALARRSGDPQRAYEAVLELLDFPTLRVVDLDHALALAAARLAADLRLRGADAVYVAVAKTLNMPLVSWDREHQRAGHIVAVRTP